MCFREMGIKLKILLSTLLLWLVFRRVLGVTDPSDLAILQDFRKGLSNPELLDWPEKGDDDPCGAPKWSHVFCSDDRVTQIQVQNLGLKGPLPSNFNKLTRLSNLGFQRNSFTGPLPSFSGLSELQYAYLNFNEFDSIPSDFFDGLTSLQVISLDNNPLNKSSGGWMLPTSLAASAQLVNLSCSDCNLVGRLPDFISGFASLSLLRLSYNTLSGVVPATYRGLNIQSLILNNQNQGGLTGPIDFLPSMGSLVTVWLHGNSFTAPIPENITECASLTEIKLNNNKLTGVVPKTLANMTQLQSVTLDNNNFLGPIPDLAIDNYTYSFNSFCQTEPGLPCSFQVEALLDFLGAVDYPSDLAAAWKGNNPCTDPWLGISCSSDKVSVINLQNHNLTGFISPSIAKLDGLVDIRLGGNNLHGTIPQNLTTLPSLKMLNLSSNNLEPPVPKFRNSVTVLFYQNPLINSPGRPSTSPPGTPPGAPSGGSSGSSLDSAGTPQEGTPSSPSGSSKKVATAVGSSVAAAVVLSSLGVFLVCRHKNKSKASQLAPSSIVVHPRDSSDPDNFVKIAIANNANKSSGASSGYPSGSMSEKHLIESGDLVISVQVLRSVTHNFAPENELGRGGFGVVYKGQLHDGTMLAVKRMEAAVVSNKALDEFHSEISVLSKVRHRNLVSLLGYSVEGNEKLLVYEYMPQGALSKHLFHWKRLKIEPLSWMRRLNIALDVAKGVEYLHNLAHQSFIHRDLKSSNILLGDDYRAKISDFGLVKLAPDGKNSVATRLAGTFGYLAPEYAVTGKITTKVDVFSFGVVLMELVTGLMALDEDRLEEARHLASWFYHIKSNKGKLRAAVDPALELTDETFEGITIVAELAGHCTAREPHQRPDMGHAVNVLSPLVEKWKPMSDNKDECLGIDFHQPLLQMVKGWQADDSSYSSSINLDDSKGSIPSRPTGFAESFTSSDGR